MRIAIAASAIAALLAATVVAKNAEERRLRKVIGAHESCIRDAGGVNPSATAESCPSTVAAQHRIARASVRCDQGLLKGDLFAVDAACSSEVKTLQAQRMAESRRGDSLAENLQRARADQAAAVSRAETRARTQAERTARGQAAVSAAPRDADGLSVCDAVCLRDRFAPPG